MAVVLSGGYVCYTNDKIYAKGTVALYKNLNLDKSKWLFNQIMKFPDKVK